MIYDIMALHLPDIEILINHSAPRKLQLIEQNFYQLFASSINYICPMQESLLATKLPRLSVMIFTDKRPNFTYIYHVYCLNTSLA